MQTVQNPETWARLALGAVGMVFLTTAVAKSVDPRHFLRHVAGLDLVSPRRVRATAWVFISLEAIGGAGLLLGISPRVMVPTILALLVGLSALTWWSTHTGRVADCGCYGGGLLVTPTQSLLLNGIYALLLVMAWTVLHDGPSTRGWQLAVAPAIGLATALLAYRVDRRLGRGAGPLVDLAPLRSGRRWKAAWSGGSPVARDQETLVVYLGPACPHCQRWARVLNIIHHAPGLPTVVGVVSVNEATRAEFAASHALRFPLRTIPTPLISQLVDAVPTTVHVAGGRIQRKWVGPMPDEFLQRFKAALFPNAHVP